MIPEDLEKKTVIAQLVNTGTVKRSEMLKLSDLAPETQEKLRAKLMYVPPAESSVHYFQK